MNSENLVIDGYKLKVNFPDQYDPDVKYKAILLNDGDIIDEINLKNSFLIGITPKNRLKDYTLWKAESIFKKGEFFQGGCYEYNLFLENKLLPELIARYNIYQDEIAYGGHSLGALAAIYTLFFTNRFKWIFSICGSFWYPDFYEFILENQIVNKNVNLYIINGLKEINSKKHKEEFMHFPDIHKFFRDNLEFAKCEFDDFGHLGNLDNRFNKVFNWINS